MNIIDKIHKFESIQLLRFLATVLVAWTHIRFSLKTYNPSEHSWWITSALGAIGVDLFFVISGFVIAMSASRIKNQNSVYFTVKSFVANRITRIGPFYWLMTIPMVVYKWDVLDANSYWNAVFFIPIFDGAYGISSPPVSFGWSLCFEVFFYLVASGLIFIRATNFSTSRAVVACAFGYLGLIVITSFAYHGSWYLPKFVLNPICLEFAFGAAIYYLRQKIRMWFAMLSLALFLVTVVLASSRLDFLAYYQFTLNDWGLSWLRLATWGIPCTLLVIGCVGIEMSRPLKLPRFVITLGDASFSTYLIQVYVNIGVSKVSRYLDLSTVGSIILHFAIVFIGGFLLWKVVEVPLTRSIRKFFCIGELSKVKIS